MRRLSLAWIVLAACTSTELDGEPEAPRPAAIAPIETPPLVAAPVAANKADPDPRGGDDDVAEPGVLVLSPPSPSVTECGAAADLLRDSADALRANHPEIARGQWLRLIRDYPSCPQVPHVYVALAEHFFAQGDLASAKQTYERAAQFPDAEVRAFALYKLAWCELGLRDGTHALAHFVDVVRAAGPDPSPALARLRDAAVRDSVIAYVDVGRPGKAVAFYRHLVGDAQLHAVVDRLAQTYRERGDSAAAQQVCASAGKGACVTRP